MQENGTHMPSDMSIVVVESDRRTLHDVADCLKSFGGISGTLAMAPTFQEGIKHIHSDVAQIFFLEVIEIEQGVKEITSLVRQYPQMTVIVTATEKNPDWILRLIRAGASEYLTKPIDTAEMVASLQRVVRLHQQKNETHRTRGTVISCYNPSGGMGTTTLAVNLAASLAAHREKVILVDLNLSCGDVASFLDLTPRYTLASVTAGRGLIDTNFLKSVIVTHASGVHVLCAPHDLGETARIQPEQLRDVIAVLQSTYNYVILDTGGQLSGSNQTVFECSDLILFITLLSLPALKNAKRYLAAINNEVPGSGKVRLLINRYFPKDDIKISDAEKVLNIKAFATVPNAYQDVKTSINKGVPLVTCFPASPLRKAMDDLVKKISMEKISSDRAVLRDSSFRTSGTRGDLTWHSEINIQ